MKRTFPIVVAVATDISMVWSDFCGETRKFPLSRRADE